VPIFLAALLIARGLPALVYRRLATRTQTLAAALLQATTLSFLVVAGRIGVDLGLLRPVVYAALVTAGLLSVVFFRRRRSRCSVRQTSDPTPGDPNRPCGTRLPDAPRQRGSRRVVRGLAWPPRGCCSVVDLTKHSSSTARVTFPNTGPAEASWGHASSRSTTSSVSSLRP
jgi:hypothetical protein